MRALGAAFLAGFVLPAISIHGSAGCDARGHLGEDVMVVADRASSSSIFLSSQFLPSWPALPPMRIKAQRPFSRSPLSRKTSLPRR